MDQVADEYNKNKDSYKKGMEMEKIAVLLKEVEEMPVLYSIGELKEKRVLDLACGEGRYSRLLKQKGAFKVTGVDISSDMIELAKQQEEQNKLGVEFFVKDVVSMGKIGEYDLISGVYLLHYASSKDMLLKMANSVLENLTPGGRFIGVIGNSKAIKSDPQEMAKWKEYHIQYHLDADAKDGQVMQLDLLDMKFTIYYYSFETYVETFIKAGFINVKFLDVSMLLNNVGTGHWLKQFKYPWYAILEATKPSK